MFAGGHDVKSIESKLRDAGGTKLNSPWNIAAAFNVDLSFNPAEIGAMRNDYARERGVAMDVVVTYGKTHKEVVELKFWRGGSRSGKANSNLTIESKELNLV